jgi:hypothetical protein
VAGGGLVQDAGFHQVRGVLAHFWENWGRRVSRRHLRRHHQDADELLSLLSWLEIALHECLDTRSGQKTRLFCTAEILWKSRA